MARTRGGALTRERVVDAAVRLADAGGVETLTMRALGRELGVEAMSLYHHVPGKDALLDAMVDAVFAEVGPPEGDGWREALRHRCVRLRAALDRHRWAAPLLESRATPGAATLDGHDAVLGVLRAGGFDVALAAHAFAALDAYVYGSALQDASLPFETGAEAAAMAPGMLAAFPAGRWPHLGELLAEHVLAPGYDHRAEFGWGLDLLLDALEQRRAADAARP
ncbi:TetR/AcrR family transcriptional regulator C-terminal domain-containing protein [Cellulomonas endophytica]|uniref:TetR/AcrR family transcriptional regulator C-terminal domain-containing protein n=1 Tax=Cellulomonas endophytica TaxID=2494735 RepID=UPI0010135F9D|nr:TetR/AcrR family transcriptional regulator C-terminal domain-containing protein [Cellulomonas endophytica]